MPAASDEENPWLALWRRQPEGGGAFGGRNNALTKLVGFMRAKDFPLEAALDMAQDWNRRYCDPPLTEREVHRRVERGWVEWLAGTNPDRTPEEALGVVPEREMPTIKSVAELLDIADDPDRRLKWLAEDLIQEDGVTVVSAPSGNGKTWLILDLCRLLTRGDGEELGLWLGKYTLPRKGVLYMDEENGERTMGERLKKLGFDAGNERFFNWSDSGLRLENASDRKTIVDACGERDLSVVIFDSLKAFHSRDENSATEMRKVGDWLRELVLGGLCVIVLHHDKKGGFQEGGTEQDRTRGSGDITAFSQSVLGLVQRGQVYTLSKRKIRNAPNDHALIMYAIVTDPAREGGVRLDVEAAQKISEANATEKAENKMFGLKLRFLQAVSDLTGAGEQATLGAVITKAKMAKADAIAAKKALLESGEMTLQTIPGQGRFPQEIFALAGSADE